MVLFDNIDKAHPAVMDILLQILSEGQLTDQNGKSVSFKNTVVVLTSNKQIDPSILGRLDSIIDFKHINAEAVDKILATELKELDLNLQKSKEASESHSDAAVEHLHNALTLEPR